MTPKVQGNQHTNCLSQRSIDSGIHYMSLPTFLSFHSFLNALSLPLPLSSSFQQVTYGRGETD